MLRQLFHWVALSALLAACIQAAPAPTPTESRAQPAPTVTPLSFPTAIPEESPTPAPTPQSIFPPVTAVDWQLGPTNARVTIVEYGDFQ
jgi:hypothetical protein